PKGAKGTEGTVAIAECYLSRMDQMPLSVLTAVFDCLEKCLAHKGRQLINSFAEINIEKLSNDDIRYWFNNMAIDSVDDIATELEMDVPLLKSFLQHNSGNITLYRERMLKFLQQIKEKVITGQ